MSKEDYLDATYALYDTGTVDRGTLRIRGRGNSTWTLPKKPYRLNFDVPTAPLGMTANQRNWALLANAYDPSKLHNAFAFTVGQQLDGLDWTPEYRPVEVILNGDYVGLYQLCDLVRMEAGRLDLTAADADTGLGVTGAYLVEIDAVNFDGDFTWTTTHGVEFKYDTPEEPTIAQATFIQDAIQAFEDALFDTDWLDPDNGYASHIDVSSFIDWMLVNELIRNWDSNFNSSCKVYRTRDTAEQTGRLHMGPLWDQDLAFGLEWSGDDPTNTLGPEGWHTSTAVWYDRLLDDPTFYAAVQARWADLKAILDAMGPGAWIDAATETRSAGWARDEARWDQLFLAPGSPSMTNEATVLKAWLSDRIAWLDAQFAS